MDKRLNSKKEKIELQNEINPNLLNIPDFMKETLINAVKFYLNKIRMKKKKLNI